MANFSETLSDLLGIILYGSSSDAPVSALQLTADLPTDSSIASAAAGAAAKDYGFSSNAGSGGVAVIDLNARGISGILERQPDVSTLRSFAKSIWVRAAIDYHKRMIGQADLQIAPEDSTAKPSRRDKQVLSSLNALFRAPNAAGDSYTVLKEKLIEDYLVIGHGCLELDLNRDLTVRGIRSLDAARIGFVKNWDGTRPDAPRYCEFTDLHSSQIKRYLANEQIMCLVNRPVSFTALGTAHIEILHKTVIALLSGDDFLVRQILQPVAQKLISLGEGATEKQVQSFKYQLSQVREALAVIGNTKDPQVFNLAASADEMKILDGCEWFVRQVAAVFNISTAKLKLAVDTSRANTESMFADDVEGISGELHRLIELENRTFIRPFEYAGEVNLTFSYPILHQKDEKSQATIASLQTRQPWASMNEARTRTGEKPYDTNKFPYADEPLLQTPSGLLPYSVWAKQVGKFAKNLEKPDAADNQAETAQPDS